MPIREHKARFIDELVPGFYELGLEGGIMTVESDQPLCCGHRPPEGQPGGAFSG
jgi:hypothetical protein